MAHRIIVTLIHGTWAKGAPWTRRRQGSALRKAIEDAFPGRVEFRPPFCWSGRNGLRARREAAERLRKKLVEAPTPDVGTRHFLVAHSHGGNVALYALRDLSVRNRTAGVAVLSTPFLVAKRRDLGIKGPLLLVPGFLGWSWLAGYLVSQVVGPSTAVATAVATGLFMLLTWGFFVLRQRVEEVEQYMQLSPPAHGRLWIARLVGDEAAAGLQTGQLAGWAVAQAHRLFVRAEEWAEKTGASSMGSSIRRVVIGLGIALSTWRVGESLGVTDRSAAVLAGFIAVVGAGLLIVVWGLLPQVPRVVVPYATMVMTPLALGLASVLVLPFGFERAVYGLLLEVHSEPTPLGKWTVNQYRSVHRPADAGPRGGLAHSEVYEHAKVLNDLTTWMERVCRAQSTGCDDPIIT